MAAVVVALLVGDRPATSEALDPDNPGADGARAVARVLDDQGVDVQVVRGADALDRAELGPSTTVLVTSTYLLGAQHRRRACSTRWPGPTWCWPSRNPGRSTPSTSRPRPGPWRPEATAPPGVPTRC